MKKFCLAFYLALIFTSHLNAKTNHIVRLPQIKSCNFYKYRDGVDFKLKRDKSFQIISTSKVQVFDNDRNFIYFALEEAKAEAKVNLANFLKLNDLSNMDNFLIQDLKVRKSGRLIQNRSQIKKDLQFLNVIFSNGFRGIRLIDSCYVNGKYIMATIEVTDKTYNMSEMIEKQMR